MQSYALWQQATIEITCHDHSLCMLVVTFNRSQVNIGKASMPRSLYHCLFVPHTCVVLHAILLVVNHRFNTSTEWLQKHPLLFTTKRSNRTFFCEGFTWHDLHILVTAPFCCDRKSPSSMCTKLHTVAASNNRDHAPQSLFTYAVVTFNR